MRPGRPLVLGRPVDPQAPVDLVGEATHVGVVEGVPEPVVDHGVDQLGVAHAGPEPGLGDQVGGLAHRLHAPRDQQPGLAELDVLGGGGDGVEPGQADLVDGEGGHGHGDAAPDGGLPGRDLALPGLEHVAHDHVLDRARVGPGPLQGGRDGPPAQLDRGQRGQRPAEPPDGRPGPGADHRLGSLEHGCSPFADLVRVYRPGSSGPAG
jgi:hypothetical protein